MRRKSLVLALTAVGGIASAQPGPPPQPPPPPMDTTMTTTSDPGTPVDPPPPPPPVVESTPPPQQTMIEPATDDTRPSYLAFGLGIGYTTPMALDMPNISSLRLRMPSGLTFEPAVRISNTSANTEPPVGTDETDKFTTLGLALLVRLPVVTHGKVDLEAVGTVGFANSKSNPEGDYNTTTSTSFGIGYGIAVSYWLSKHWNFSMSVTNPLVDYRHSKNQLGVPNMVAKSSDTTIGIIFSPDVFMMLHLYN